MLRSWTFLLLLLAQRLPAAEFRGLGDLPGGLSDSRATAVSADGKYVVGAALSDVSSEPFIWDQQHGLQRLDNILTVITPGAAHDISADGSVIVGRADFGNVWPFRWENAGFRFLDSVSPGTANAVSYDGRIVVGTEHYSPGGGPAPVTGTAFRWSEEEGLTQLADLPGGPDCSRGNDLSADGRIIVGKGDCDASFQAEDLGTAVRWVDGGASESLGSLTSGGFDVSVAAAVSSDGNTIVGYSSSKLGLEPFLWRAAESMIGLGQLDGANYGEALDVTGNGRLVVGQSGGRAFLWTQSDGMRDLQAMLSGGNYKLDLNGWTLTSATALSPDGLFIVGEGINPAGETESWRADLFHIPDDDGDGKLDITDLNNVRNNFGLNGLGDMPPYDGVIDIYDLNFVRNNFGRPPSSNSVPEPKSLLLGLMLAAGGYWVKGRIRRPLGNVPGFSPAS